MPQEKTRDLKPLHQWFFIRIVVAIIIFYSVLQIEVLRPELLTACVAMFT